LKKCIKCGFERDYNIDPCPCGEPRYQIVKGAGKARMVSGVVYNGPEPRPSVGGVLPIPEVADHPVTCGEVLHALRTISETSDQRKDTNPKDTVGIRKVPASVVPREVIAEIGLGLLEGARKYGRHNYRIAGIRYSVYFDAAMRHLDAWWEGEDIDPDSGLSHIVKALSTLTVLRDAMINEMFTDDRPPSMKPGWHKGLNEGAAALIDKYPNALPPFVKET
jgi:hypothetical protein